MQMFKDVEDAVKATQASDTESLDSGERFRAMDDVRAGLRA